MPTSESMTVVIDHASSEVNRQLMDKHMAVLGPTSAESQAGSAHQEDDDGVAASKRVSFKLPSMGGEVVAFPSQLSFGQVSCKS